MCYRLKSLSLCVDLLTAMFLLAGLCMHAVCGELCIWNVLMRPVVVGPLGDSLTGILLLLCSRTYMKNN